MAIPKQADPAPVVVPDVPTAKATVTTTTGQNPQSSQIDTILVVGTLLIIAGVVAALIFVTINQAQLAILASIVSGLMGAVIGGYTGYRWGASDALKKQTATSTTTPQA
jgi:uncharacterized membrane protein YeaQ/YmgE (transglycosylase-associated protein family)